jgi:hypothetical protein
MKTVRLVSVALAFGTDAMDATLKMLSTISSTTMLAIIFLLNSFHYSFTKPKRVRVWAVQAGWTKTAYKRVDR